LKSLGTLLGHVGTVGVILLLFFAGVIFVDGRGASLPELLVEWSRAGAIFSAVLTVIGGVSKIGTWLQGLARGLAERSSERREAAEGAANAIANLGTLQEDEAEYLYGLLKSGQQRFHVGSVTPAPGLMSKKILVWKGPVGFGEWVCELHPEIEKRRDQLIHFFEGANNRTR
jgi:hypothetical protein